MNVLSKWCVLHGQDGLLFYCNAEDREHAVEQCQNAYPAEPIHVAVPCNAQGNLVLESYTEDPVCCPRCGGRTEPGELPFKQWQVHVCHRCPHSFIAVPDDETQ